MKTYTRRVFYSGMNKNIVLSLLCFCMWVCGVKAQSSYPDFTYAAERSINAVVHIAAQMEQKHSTWDLFFQDPFFNFFNNQPQSQVYQAYGSGVIIDAAGYIVTNNHVVEGADSITVTLNDKRTFPARIIGTDVHNDLALLKIEADHLQSIPYGNSDDVRIGEWVLAVGNPFNLTSTVTAGIVSAKARNLNMLSETNRVSAYIQTDAAVNSGNSGGALVNTKGELIGINAAIASNTGSYTGYSFAIPVNIVKKVVNDLKNYGRTQRVSIGASFMELHAGVADKNNSSELKGLQVFKVDEGLAAAQAGIQENDVLLAIDGKEVNSYSELKEILEQHIPGDKIHCTLNRNGKVLNVNVILKNKKGTTEIIRNNTNVALSILGAKVESIDNNIKSRYRIQGGLRVIKLNKGLLQEAGVKEGFVITAIDKQPVRTEQDVDKILGEKEGNALIEGFYPGNAITYMYYYNVTLQ